MKVKPAVVNSIPKNSILTREEGYLLTTFYVEYFWIKKKFYSLASIYELDDIINEIYAKFLEQKFFEKYNSSITTKKYFVMRSVYRSMIDMLRAQMRYGEMYSLDKEIESDGDTTFGELIPAKVDISSEAVSQTVRDKIIRFLPNDTKSKLVGNSPIYGPCKFTLRVIALHLERGYSAKEIAAMFYNPSSNRTTTVGNVNGMIVKLREFVLDNIPLY